MVLQNWILPDFSLGLPEVLYFGKRTNASIDSASGRVILDAGGSLDFESYFNAFNTGDWRRCAALQSLDVRIRLSGRVRVEVLLCRKSLSSLVATKDCLTAEARDFVISLPGSVLTSGTGEGYLAVRLASPSGGIVESVQFATEDTPRRKVRLAGVITHFKRENWVLPALKRIEVALERDADFANSFHLYVVDNSQSLEIAESPHFTHVLNGNFGGAGGFTRGLLEAEQAGDFTHCLFMDDDATLEVESISRTIKLLSYCVDPRIAVAGTLFLDHQPQIVYEAGAHLDFALHCHHQGTDVSKRKGRYKLNSRKTNPRYGGWWFFAFPIPEVRHYPFPYFVRGDDSTFGYSNRFNIVCPTGVACWGESFENKDTPLTRYLDARHMLRTALVFGNTSASRMLRSFAPSVDMLLKGFRYAAVEATIAGLTDALKPSEFWKRNADLGDVRQRLAGLVGEEKTVAPDVRCGSEPHRQPSFRSKFRETLLRKMVRTITLNGLLVPRRLCPANPVVLPKSWGVNPKMVFPYKSVVYMSKGSGAFYESKENRLRHLRLKWMFFRMRLAVLYASAFRRREVVKTFENLTTRDFWLEIYPEFRTRGKVQTECEGPSSAAHPASVS